MITKQEIENIALLSKLHVAEEELPSLMSDIEHMIEFIHSVKDADVPIEETDSEKVNRNVYRKDRVTLSVPSEEMLKNAPNTADSYILVRKRA